MVVAAAIQWPASVQLMSSQNGRIQWVCWTHLDPCQIYWEFKSNTTCYPYASKVVSLDRDVNPFMNIAWCDSQQRVISSIKPHKPPKCVPIQLSYHHDMKTSPFRHGCIHVCHGILSSHPHMNQPKLSISPIQSSTIHPTAINLPSCDCKATTSVAVWRTCAAAWDWRSWPSCGTRTGGIQSSRDASTELTSEWEYPKCLVDVGLCWLFLWKFHEIPMNNHERDGGLVAIWNRRFGWWLMMVSSD